MKLYLGDNEIKAGIKVDQSLAKGLLDGSVTEVSCPKLGVTSLKSHRFFDFDNLQKLDLTGIHDIPEATCRDCYTLNELILDENITRVRQYAFSNCSNVNLEINFNGNNTIIDTSAFQHAKIKSLTGTFSDIGTNAFADISSLKPKIHIKVNGKLEASSFGVNYTINDFQLDPTSIITSVSSNVFQNFGRARANPETNIFTFDFRNSTFTSVGSAFFAGSSGSTSGITNTTKYFDIYFPTSCVTINTQAFQYSDHFNIYYKNIPALSNTNAFSNATNFKNFFPYNLVQTAKTSTNWSSTTSGIVNSLYGYSDANEFEVGDILPTTDSEGYELTWYSDRELTTEVTTVTDASAMYYCSVGARIAARLTLNQFQATCTVSDGTHTYVDGDRVLVGTNLTITAVGDVGYPEPYLFTLNGNNITSGATYTVTENNFAIVCIYYDGETAPVDPVFANNVPAQVKIAVDNGLHRLFWNIGDERQITMTDGTTWTMRYVDQQANRYQKSDGSGYSNAVFELNPIMKSAVMNSTSTNVGGWPASRMCTTTMAEIYDILPADWKAVVSEVKIPSATSGNDSTIVTADNKVFIASGQEIFADSYVTNYYYDEGCTRFDWYTAHNTSNDRIKKYNGSNYSWWLRSPYRGISSNFCFVNSGGSFTYNGANYSIGAVACLSI